MNESCTWCGAEVEPGDGFRGYLLPAATNTAAGSTGERRAVFCRLEHLIPWSIQDAHWEAGGMTEPPALDEAVTHCSHCDTELIDTHVLLVRHRGEHRIGDGFCSVEHMTSWAKAGGRWQ
ncbi:MAG TPA: hypothetical protein VFY30_00940 [Solirubrobacterales bacterium]|nr:hypothetical protein [Solirubrobacterales bacterium]